MCMVFSPTIGCTSVCEGTSLVERVIRLSSVNAGGDALALDLVPVADDARERDLQVRRAPRARGRDGTSAAAPARCCRRRG